MLTETALDQLPVWWLYLLTVAFLLVGGELGYWIGTRRRARMQEGEKAPASALVGSTLGLLAFMLAFTFGMAGTRYDARRQLVLDEASAILRAYQRAQFLPEPVRSQCSQLLVDYTRLRTTMVNAKSMAEIEQVVSKSEVVQAELWSATATLASQPSALLAGFIQSLSEVTDLQLKRVRAAVWNRIPFAIIITLCVVAFLALMAVGYGAGLAGNRNSIPAVMLVLAFSAIIVLIMDLERPRQQLFRVDQEPMHDVLRRMETPP